MNNIQNTFVNQKLNFNYSKLGFGGHSLTLDNAEQQQFALQKSIQLGCNVIDTSCDYGTSQKLIGLVLNGMINENKLINRDEIVIMSKVGPLDNYIDERNHSIISYLKNECKVQDIDNKMIELADGIHHYSLNKEIIQNEINRSLNELNIECLDVMVINHPEKWIQSMYLQTNDLNETMEMFYNELRNVFECFEENIEKGKLQYYGIASNNFINNSDIFIDLEKCLSIAKSIKDNHHFRMIQFPYNLKENQIYTSNYKNNNNLLTFAKDNNLSTFSYRPINAQLNNYLIYRFAEYKFDYNLNDFEKLIKEYEGLCNAIAHAELYTPWYTIDVKEEKMIISKEIERSTVREFSSENLQKIRDSISWGHIIMTNYDQLESYFTFQKILKNRILPEQKYIFSYLSEISNKINLNDSNVSIKSQVKQMDVNQLNNFKRQADQWLTHYQQVTNKFYKVFSDLLTLKHQNLCEKVKKNLSNLSNGDLDYYSTLSQKSIRCLVDTPNLDCVLVGMHKTKYVDDLLYMNDQTGYSLLETRPKDKQVIIDKVIRNLEVKDEPLFTVELDNNKQ
ncbi:hypothetical protein ABK040_008807 [Willaertia magna]